MRKFQRLFPNAHSYARTTKYFCTTSANEAIVAIDVMHSDADQLKIGAEKSEKFNRWEKVVINNAAHQGMRIDRLVSVLYPTLPFALIQRRIREKDILVHVKNDEKPKRCEGSDRIGVGDAIVVNKIIFGFTSPSIEAEEEHRKEKYASNTNHNSAHLSGIANLISVIYKDEHFIAINKPIGLPVQAGISKKVDVVSLLPYFLKNVPIVPRLVHRLDMDTSGVLLLARSKESASLLAQKFKSKDEIKKDYLAITCGNINVNKGIIECKLKKVRIGGEERVVVVAMDEQQLKHQKNHLINYHNNPYYYEALSQKSFRFKSGVPAKLKHDSKNGSENNSKNASGPKDKTGKSFQVEDDDRRAKVAVTDYEVLETAGDLALLRMTPLTGRSHQLRVHASSILGSSILGDTKYGPGVPSTFWNVLDEKAPMHLHARSITFDHPFYHKKVVIKAPLPNHFQNTMEIFGFTRKL